MEESPEVEAQLIVATRAVGPTAGGQGILVNAGDRGDGMLLSGRGTLRRVDAYGNGFPQTAQPPGWSAAESSDSKKPET